MGRPVAASVTSRRNRPNAAGASVVPLRDTSMSHTASPSRLPAAMGAVARHSGAVEGQRDAPQGFARFRLDLDLAPAVAAVLVPDDGERCREGRRVGQGEGNRFVDIEGVVVIDVETDQPADHALPAANRAGLDLVAVGARTQLRIAQAVSVRDARPGPVDLDYVAGLGPMGSHAGCRVRHQRATRDAEHARGQEPTHPAFHLQLPSRFASGRPWQRTSGRT